MNDNRIGDVGRLARIPSSRVTKWLVVGFWIVVVGFLAGPSSKLQSVLNNEAASWLPADAQSTQVVDQISAFQSTNEFPAVIVYERPSGVTPADLAAVTAQVARFNALEPVKRDSVGPIPSADGQALQVIVPVDAGEAGWDSLSTTATQMRDIAANGPAGLSMHVTGPVGYGADSSEAFSGIDGKLLYSAMAVVILILLITYRSPILWLLPVVSAGTALFVAQGVIYFLADGDTLTVNAQSSGILTVIVFGAGTDYALLLVARYREELRRPVDPRLGCHGRRRHALPPLRVDELDEGTGPRRRDRHRRRPARHADAAAGPARRPGPLGLLARPPDPGLRRRHPRRGLGPHRRPDRPGTATHLGGDVAPARDRVARGAPAQRGRAAEQGLLLHDAAVGDRRADRREALPRRRGA